MRMRANGRCGQDVSLHSICARPIHGALDDDNRRIVFHENGDFRRHVHYDENLGYGRLESIDNVKCRPGGVPFNEFSVL